MDVLKKTGTVLVMFEVKTRARKLHLRAVVAGMRMVPTAHIFAYFVSIWCNYWGRIRRCVVLLCYLFHLMWALRF